MPSPFTRRRARPPTSESRHNGGGGGWRFVTPAGHRQRRGPSGPIRAWPAHKLSRRNCSVLREELTPEERKARFAEYREQVKHLTDDQKWELSAPMREAEGRDGQVLRHVPKEKSAYLDERIDRSEKARKEWEKKGEQAKGGQGKAGGPGRGFGPGGPKVGRGGGQGGPGGRAATSAEEIEKRRKQYLDRTSPEERAQRDQFRKEMDSRRKQRGLPPRSNG